MSSENISNTKNEEGMFVILDCFFESSRFSRWVRAAWKAVGVAFYFAIALDDAEDHHFARRAPSSFAVQRHAKHGFTAFQLTSERLA